MDRAEQEKFWGETVTDLLEEVEALKVANDKLMKELDFVEQERDEWHLRYDQLEAS